MADDNSIGNKEARTRLIREAEEAGLDPNGVQFLMKQGNYGEIANRIRKAREAKTKRFRASPDGVLDETEELDNASTISIGEPTQRQAVVLGEGGEEPKEGAQGEGFVPGPITLQEELTRDNSTSTVEIGPDPILDGINDINTSLAGVNKDLRNGSRFIDPNYESDELSEDIPEDVRDEDLDREIKTTFEQVLPVEFEQSLSQEDRAAMYGGSDPLTPPEESSIDTNGLSGDYERVNDGAELRESRDEPTEEGLNPDFEQRLEIMGKAMAEGQDDDELPGAQDRAFQGDEEFHDIPELADDDDVVSIFYQTGDSLNIEATDNKKNDNSVEEVLARIEEDPIYKSLEFQTANKTKKKPRKARPIYTAALGLSVGLAALLAPQSWKQDIVDFYSGLASNIQTSVITQEEQDDYNSQEQVGDDDAPFVDDFDDGYETQITDPVISAQLTDGTEVTYEPSTPDVDALAANTEPVNEEPQESEDPVSEQYGPTLEESVQEYILPTNKVNITIADEPRTIVRTPQPKPLEIVQNRTDAYQTIKVEKGQTLSQIASTITGDESYSSAANRTLMNHIQDKNKIQDKNLIFAGDELVVPQSWESYEVQKGDILSGLVEDYEGIADANEIADADLIFTGQNIFVPKQKVEEKVEENFLGGDSFAINQMYQDLLESRIDPISRKEEEYEEFLQGPIDDQQFSDDTKLEEIFQFYRDTGATLESTTETYEQRLDDAAKMACNETINGLERATWSEILELNNLESKDLRKVRSQMSCSKKEAYQKFMDQRSYEVQEAKVRGESVQDIAKDFGISPTTVYRDLKRDPVQRIEENLMEGVNFDSLEIPESNINTDQDADGKLELRNYEKPLEEKVFDNLGYNTASALRNYAA